MNVLPLIATLLFDSISSLMKASWKKRSHCLWRVSQVTLVIGVMMLNQYCEFSAKSAWAFELNQYRPFIAAEANNQHFGGMAGRMGNLSLPLQGSQYPFSKSF
jgi:hypothetical protein